MDPSSENIKIPNNYQRLNGSKLEPAHGASLVGPVDAEETLSVSIYVRSKPEAPPLPDEEYWITNPPGRRKFLTHKQFEAQYGADQSELEMVAEFARSYGLDVKEINSTRGVVTVFGTVDKMNNAFAVKLGHYESPTQKYRGLEGYIHIPSHLSNIVEAVLGLDNRRILESGGGVPPAGISRSPRDVAQIYNFPLNRSAAGQTIGILVFGGGYDSNDIQHLFTDQGVRTPLPIPVSADGITTNSPTIGRPTDEDYEVTMDIEIAGSVADGARIVVYFAQSTAQGFADAFSKDYS